MTNEELNLANQITKEIKELEEQIEFLEIYQNSTNKKPPRLELECKKQGEYWQEKFFKHSILQEEIVPILLFAKQKRKRILETKLNVL